MSRASYARVQATVGVGTVLNWDFGVAYTKGGEGKVSVASSQNSLSRTQPLVCDVNGRHPMSEGPHKTPGPGVCAQARGPAPGPDVRWFACAAVCSVAALGLCGYARDALSLPHAALWLSAAPGLRPALHSGVVPVRSQGPGPPGARALPTAAAAIRGGADAVASDPLPQGPRGAPPPPSRPQGRPPAAPTKFMARRSLRDILDVVESYSLPGTGTGNGRGEFGTGTLGIDISAITAEHRAVPQHGGGTRDLYDELAVLCGLVAATANAFSAPDLCSVTQSVAKLGASSGAVGRYLSRRGGEGGDRSAGADMLAALSGRALQFAAMQRLSARQTVQLLHAFAKMRVHDAALLQGLGQHLLRPKVFSQMTGQEITMTLWALAKVVTPAFASASALTPVTATGTASVTAPASACVFTSVTACGCHCLCLCYCQGGYLTCSACSAGAQCDVSPTGVERW